MRSPWQLRHFHSPFRFFHREGYTHLRTHILRFLLRVYQPHKAALYKSHVAEPPVRAERTNRICRLYRTRVELLTCAEVPSKPLRMNPFVFLSGEASENAINKLKCPHCNYIAKHRRTLKRHLIIHSGVRSFSCDICGKLFTRREHVKRHSLVRRPMTYEPVSTVHITFQTIIYRLRFVDRNYVLGVYTKTFLSKIL